MILSDLTPPLLVDADLRSRFEVVLSAERHEALATFRYRDSVSAFDRVVAGNGERRARHYSARWIRLYT